MTVQYVLVVYATGKWSRRRGTPTCRSPSPWAQGQVIPGWDEGVPGMKVGGRRELIIPPALAYAHVPTPGYPGPTPPSIFVVDLLKIG